MIMFLHLIVSQLNFCCNTIACHSTILSCVHGNTPGNRHFLHFFIAAAIDRLHYDVIRAKSDSSCSRPTETGPSVLKNGGKQAGKPAGQKRY